MKKVLALVLVALVLLSAPVAMSIQFPRQVDPSSAPTDPVYGQGLYLFYGSIVAALSGGNFTAARGLLAQTSFIHIPPEILDAVNSFNGLVNSTANLFKVINYQLVNASSYLGSGRVDLARGNLTGAVSNLRAANQTLTQLFGAEPQLAAITGIPSSLFLQKLQPLETIYTSDTAQANRLLAVLTGLTKLGSTEVTLSVVQTHITVGSNVTVSGALRGPSGVPLPSRVVTIYFQNQAIGNATTDGSGDYSARLPTPYFYQQNATMFSSFLPRGNDSLVYAPSSSALVNVTVGFATPSISFAAPNSAYAGQLLNVNGTLSLGGNPLAGYSVTLSGFQTSALGSPLTSEDLTGGNGSFSVSLTPPSSLSAGNYPLTLKTSSNGSTGPLAIRIQVAVIKESPTVVSSSPVFALAGLPLTVSGRATVNATGVAGANVLNTSPSPPVDTTTSSSGSFSFTVTPSLTTANGPWTYTVEVYPTQSWISASPVNVSIFVINPLVLLFPASSLGLLGLVVRRRRTPVQGQVQALQQVEADTKEKPKSNPTSGLPGIYFAAVALVERATSISLLPQMTVREYLRAVKDMPKGLDHFRAISYALENFLYAGVVGPAGETTARAELDALRREIES